MDIDGRQSTLRSNTPTQHPLQPTNSLAGPSTIADQPLIPTVYLPPPLERPKPRPYFDSTQDLLARFQLLSAYDKYVRPYSLPVGVAGTSQELVTAPTDKGKGKEKEVLPREVASPAAAQTPGAGIDGDDEEAQGKGEKKWKSSYKHLIKGVPGKHSMKKDDYLMTMMQVPPKQRIAITPFDVRTQRDAFSVSLEGLKGWNINSLVAESPQAREDRRKRKELKKLAKHASVAPGTSPSVVLPNPSATAGTAVGVTAAQQAPTRSGTPRPGTQPAIRLQAAPPNQPPPQTGTQPSGITPAGVGTPRSASTPGPTSSAPLRHTPIPTPAPTPDVQQATGTGDAKRDIKRKREDSAIPPNETPQIAAGVTVSTNGPVKMPSMVISAKPGSNGVRPRPLKKQRMDTQGHAREVPVQQPTPHA